MASEDRQVTSKERSCRHCGQPLPCPCGWGTPLPTWDECKRAVETSGATYLQTFIYQNEPTGAGCQPASEFRLQLGLMLSEQRNKLTASELPELTCEWYCHYNKGVLVPDPECPEHKATAHETFEPPRWTIYAGEFEGVVIDADPAGEWVKYADIDRSSDNEICALRLPDDPQQLLVTTARDAGFSDTQWKAMFYQQGPYDVTFPCFTTKKFIALLLERLQQPPAQKANEHCQHDLLKPDTTIEVIDPWKAKCKVCIEFFDLPGRPSSSEGAGE